MIVSVDNFFDVLKELDKESTLAVDTETTGLFAYNGDSLFSIIIASIDNSYYFNFQEYLNLSSEFVLDKKIHLAHLGELLSKPRTYFLHNAKFDLHMLFKDGVTIGGKIHDTEMVARLLYNQHNDYSLEACAKRIGLVKSNAVDEYITEHKLYTEEETPEGKTTKVLHFDKVPFPIISAYGIQDGKVTFGLGMYQLNELHKQSMGISSGKLPLLNVYKNDCQLTKAVFHMERRGIKINREYVQQAYYYEMDRKNQAQAEFEDIAKSPLVDSNKALAAVFSAAGEKYPTTEKGNPSFKADVLEGFDTPLAKVLLKYRSALKLANTYYANFLKLADKDDVIHANLRLAGTVTGRLSCSNPNLQNLAKEEDQSQAYTVRRSFVPRPEHCFVMIDYQAAEYRLLLDRSEQTDVCHAVLNGLDVHQATANTMAVDRKSAKTLNFMLLYGGGVEKLATTLDLPEGRATQLRDTYFSAMPRVTDWSNKVKKSAKNYNKVTNWAGFVCHFPSEFNISYTAPNHIIQGGCAQIIRFAMPLIHNLLEGKKSRMLLSIHDEILLEMHQDELELVEPIKKIMEDVYPFLLLPQACEVSHSWISWGDKINGYPTYETRNQVQEKGLGRS